MNGPWKQEAEVSVHAAGLCSKLHIEEELVDLLIKYNQVCVSYRLSINDVLLHAKNLYQSLVSKYTVEFLRDFVFHTDFHANM